MADSQIHDLRTSEDLEEIEAPGGALEAFVEARDAGQVRFIGVTGHHAPKILEYAIESWPVDSVLMPVNPAEAVLGGFPWTGSWQRPRIRAWL